MSLSSEKPTRDVARVTIELTSALHVGAGRDTEFLDELVVMDANGLPAIAGSSIAGVLSSLMVDEEERQSIFGLGHGQTGKSNLVDEKQSRLIVSWAHIHNSQNVPVPFLSLEPLSDKLLDAASNLIVRDHVRIGPDGTAQENALFNECVVAAGHRFTFELLLKDAANKSDMNKLLELLSQPGTSFGGRTRRGLGRFKIVKCQREFFDLTVRKQEEAFLKLSNDVAEPVSEELLPLYDVNQGPSLAFIEAKIKVRPRLMWLIGGGAPKDQSLENEPKLAPYRESKVSWTITGGKSHGSFSQEKCTVIPGSSIKGAIRHRTKFWYAVFSGQFSGNGTLAEMDNKLESEISKLFGCAANTTKTDNAEADSSQKTEQTGQAGLVYFQDVWVEPKNTNIQHHVSLDRFTSGPMDGMLFSEEINHGADGEVEFSVLLKNSTQVCDVLMKALKKAIDEFVKGRVQLGAGHGRGHGYFDGSVKWDKAGGGVSG